MFNSSHFGNARLLAIFSVFAIIIIGLFWWTFALVPKKVIHKNNNVNTNVICIQDAKLCPDGSYVSRGGANCAFAECPKTNANLNANTSITNHKRCEKDSDCGLSICSGCFNNDYLKTVTVDNACRVYVGYSCVCVSNNCLAVIAQ